MFRNLLLRHQVVQAVRRYLGEQGFIDVETPILTKSTPEGARDFLVPSRLQPGEFYALPQSPQLFKQLLMIAGFERYYQIARAFRDEDLRADRQPEHTQIDVEMSFIEEQDIQDVVEGMFAAAFKETLGVELERPFPRLTYADAMARYGSDKPDLRFGMEIVDVTRHRVAGCDFRVFADAVAAGGVVRGIRAEGGGGFSRKDVDDLAAEAAVFGAHGVLPVWIEEEGVRSPLQKFVTAEQMSALIETLGGRAGDLLLFVADRKSVVEPSLGALRLALADAPGRSSGRAGPSPGWSTSPCSSTTRRRSGSRLSIIPSPSPGCEQPGGSEERPLELGTYAYDLVLNGVELGSGSLRISDPEMQEAVFEALGLDEDADQGQVRFPGGGHGLRHSSSRRHRAGPRPHGHAHGRGIVHPRRHRLPQDAERLVPADRCSLEGGARTAAGAPYPDI